MDHVLHPTLTDASFHTEVHYVGTDKDMGVVYCEMAGREHSEADMMDLNMRRLLLPNTPYAYEHGGLSEDIASLTNDEIRAYHAEFYNWNNIAVVVTGNVDTEQVVSCVQSVIEEEKKTEAAVKETKTQDAVNENTQDSIKSPFASHSEVRNYFEDTFPSTDMEFGSVGLCWKGPPPSDLKTYLSLNILFRYLKESSASPLFQRFVEVEDPVANDVDIDCKSLSVGAIFMIFSGVPILEDDSVSESEEDASDSDCDDDEGKDMDYLQEGVLKSLVDELFIELVDNNLRLEDAKKENVMLDVIKRHKSKFLESLEEDPHELVNYCCIVDVLQSRYLNSSAPIGSFLNVFHLFEELEKEPISYWTSLLQRHLIDSICQQVILKPNVEKQRLIEEERKANHSNRKTALGKSDEALLKDLQAALESNKIAEFKQLESPLLDSSFPSFKYEKSIEDFDHPQFNQIHSVQTNTNFFHFLIAFNIEGISDDLKKYLVLFQELFFNCHVSNYDGHPLLSYQQVIQDLSRNLCSFDASVGFGNEVFSCSYLGNYFLLSASCFPQNAELLVSRLHAIFHGITFTRDRLVAAKNLSSQLKESKRDSNDVLDAMITALVSSAEKENLKKIKINGGSVEKSISILAQEEFLDSITHRLDDEEDCMEDVLSNLQKLNDEIRAQQGFIHLAAPFDFSMDRVKKQLKSLWTLENVDYSIAKCFPSKPQQLEFQSPPPKLFYTLTSATASHLSIQIKCPLLKLLLNNLVEYQSILLVCHMLSRTEGPLYSLIRGEGLAYHASLYSSLWSNIICFDIGESVNLIAAYSKFFSLFTLLSNDIQKQIDNSFMDEKSLVLAKSSFLFQFAEERSTAPLCISHSLKSSLKGFSDDALFESTLKSISLQQVKAAFVNYFSAFLDPTLFMAVAVQNDCDKSKLDFVHFEMTKVGEDELKSINMK